MLDSCHLTSANQTLKVRQFCPTKRFRLTEWLTPHMSTLSRGSLARNSFTFWATKCFFLVFVLLAMDAAMLLAEAIFRLTGWSLQSDR